MCGRYKVTPGEFSDLKLRFNLEEIPLFKPRYNIAPTQQAPVIANLDGANRVELFQWGLVPSWAKDISIGNRMINARAETLAEKSSFKRLLSNRRCLVLADAFYEWRKEGKGKVPNAVQAQGRRAVRVRWIMGRMEKTRRPNTAHLYDCHDRTQRNARAGS